MPIRILGIDYGRRKVGLAISEGSLAEPFKVIHYGKLADLMRKLEAEVEEGKFEKVVVGISEGEMAKETESFCQSLSGRLKIPVVTFDETLTSKDAQRLAIEAGVSRQKRAKMEDAYAATLLLQNYLDSN
jgi:putative Holliday junction resolvase